jgi:ABC-type transport system involved in cytochrome c biogenesis permease subunit
MPDAARHNPLKSLLAPLASLRLTVVLLVLALVLIYAGTWAQIDNGIWQVQKQYFHSFVSWVDPAIFVGRDANGGLKSIVINGGAAPVVLKVPIPGGYTLGGLLLVNLLAAHALRFKGTWRDIVLIPAIAMSFAVAYLFPPQDYLSLVLLLTLSPLPVLVAVAPLHGKRTGVIMIHLGLILLLVGEGITSGFAVESQMRIEEGSYANFSEDIRHAELAIVDPSRPDKDAVIAIPGAMLRDGATIAHGGMPFQLKVEKYFRNSNILGPMQAQQAGVKSEVKATAGSGVGITVTPEPEATGEAIDMPSGYVTVLGQGGAAAPVGTYLISALMDQQRKPFIGPQEVRIGEKAYQIQLRFRRLYKPYAMHLMDFRFDRYLGTPVAKNFSSEIRLVDSTRNVDRNVKIWMNNPLRYAGETFFQADWNKETERGTVLQVVRNPAWSMPYLACAIGAVGLVAHFGITLLNFIRKRSAMPSAAPNAPPSSKKRPGRIESVPWATPATFAALLAVLGIYFLTIIYVFRPVGPRTAFDLKTFGTLPISHDGRIQPLDSLARNSLKVIAGRESATTSDKGDGEKISATRWLADVFAQTDGDYPVFRIDNKEVIGLLGLDPDRKRFSFNEVLQNREKLQDQVTRAFEQQRSNPKGMDLFQRKMVELGEKLDLYLTLKRMETLFLVPPLEKAEEWQPLAKGMRIADGQPPHFAAQTYLTLRTAMTDNKPGEFNTAVAAYAKEVEAKLPTPDHKVKFEALYNRIDAFTQCIVLYITAFVLVCLSWLFGGRPLRRAAVVGMVLALAIHTLGLIGRIYISGRPPVTNLAASAIFIAWGGVVLAMGLEWFYRNGIGLAAAAAMGGTSLLIADRLALTGDTMKVLQAVLDTNFWLATHVIIITLGYAATFLAGILGIVYVLMGLLTTSLDKDSSKELGRMIYGVTCFAILFSFVGTVLGGIWADQSWGRFWGWDPKENGAVMIVLANALLLHARWGGLVRERGVACLAIFGNIITAWSWFGTNMLGVGLHSYGFMDKALFWLLAFVVSQVVLIVAANVPLNWWASYPRFSAAAGGTPTLKREPAAA